MHYLCISRLDNERLGYERDICKNFKLVVSPLGFIHHPRVKKSWIAISLLKFKSISFNVLQNY